MYSSWMFAVICIKGQHGKPRRRRTPWPEELPMRRMREDVQQANKFVNSLEDKASP